MSIFLDLKAANIFSVYQSLIYRKKFKTKFQIIKGSVVSFEFFYFFLKEPFFPPKNSNTMILSKH